MPAGATRGTDSGRGRGSGWASLDVNREDPVEMALAADLQRSVMSKVAASSCVGDEQLEDDCAGEGRVSRDRLLPED